MAEYLFTTHGLIEAHGGYISRLIHSNSLSEARKAEAHLKALGATNISTGTFWTPMKVELPQRIKTVMGAIRGRD